jgi:hypothetical protein
MNDTLETRGNRKTFSQHWLEGTGKNKVMKPVSKAHTRFCNTNQGYLE